MLCILDLTSFDTHNKQVSGSLRSKTTEIYTHVSNKDNGRIKSPLDSMVKDLHLEDGVEGHEN